MDGHGQLPEVVSREEWFVARRELLAKEKELTRARDRLNADRRRLPMVRVDKPYTFEGPEGAVSLLDLFEDRSLPSYDAAATALLLQRTLGFLDRVR